MALAVTTPFEVAGGVQSILDKFTDAAPLIPHARAVQFEIALFQGQVLDAATGLTSMTLEMKNVVNNVIDTGAPVLSKTVEAAAFNGQLTQGDWDSDQGQYALFSFTEGDTNLDMTGAVANRKTFGRVVSGLGPEGRVDCASGLVQMVKSGATGLGAGAPPVPTYTFTDQDILAMANDKLKLGINRKGASFVLPAINDPTKGLMLYVEDPLDGGEPILRQVFVPIPS